MNASLNNVLITGGSNGIGKALAKRFIKAGSRVIVTGRNPETLANAAKEISNLEVFANDIANPREREKLAAYIQQNMPDINILINNAGIQRRIELAADNAPWEERQNEIDILLSAPVHLNHLLIPVLLSHGQSSLIVNVSSGGAFIPQVFAPIYSACKAALHSYTLALRHSLSQTNCRVVELIPPAVQTNLAGGNTTHGVTLDEFADNVFAKLTTDGVNEAGYGQTENISVEISGKPHTELFEVSAQRFPVKTY
jgi:uncharacterized oxidoreductase